MQRTIVIFLDIDGVLNSEVSFKYYYERWKHDKSVDLVASIDEQRLIVFHDLCQEIKKAGYRVSIVLSSTWRFSDNLIDIISRRLKKYHLKVADKTPELTNSTRGKEIALYCKRHLIRKKNVLILDDRDDMDEYKERLIQVYHRDGLTYRDVEKALLLLK